MKRKVPGAFQKSLVQYFDEDVAGVCSWCKKLCHWVGKYTPDKSYDQKLGRYVSAEERGHAIEVCCLCCAPGWLGHRGDEDTGYCVHCRPRAIQKKIRQAGAFEPIH